MGISSGRISYVPLKKSVDRSLFHTANRNYKNQQGIPTPNPLIRRYPDGQLDTRFTVGQIIDVIRKLKDFRGGYGMGVSMLLMPYEKAMLSLVMEVPNVDVKFSMQLTKLTFEELMGIKEGVRSSLQEMKSYAAGRGRGSTPGAKLSIDV